jgi:hypothetical protein
LLDHAFAEIRSEDRAVGRQFVAVGVDEMGGDGAGATAIVVDGCCLRERESLVRALDEDFDGCCAGPAAEFFVFAGELVPVVSCGCGRGEFG